VQLAPIPGKRPFKEAWMSEKKIVRSMNDLVLGVLSIILAIYLLTSKNIVKNDVATGAGGPFAQAGTYVDLLAGILLILAAVLVIKSFNFKKTDNVTGFTFLWNKEIVITAISLILYTILLPIIGFTITTLALLLVLVTVFSTKEITRGERKLTKAERKKVLLLSVVFSLVMLLVIYVVFSVLLKVTLP
jgi:hypothetical protein